MLECFLPTPRQIVLYSILSRLFHAAIRNTQHPLPLACIKRKPLDSVFPSTTDTFWHLCQTVSWQRSLNARNDVLNDITCNLQRKKISINFSRGLDPSKYYARQSWKTENLFDTINLSPPAASFSSARICAVARSLTSTNDEGSSWATSSADKSEECGAITALYQSRTDWLSASGEATSCRMGP